MTLSDRLHCRKSAFLVLLLIFGINASAKCTFVVHITLRRAETGSGTLHKIIDVTTFLTRQLLTDFEEIIPGFHKLLPEGQVGPHALGEEDDQRGEPEHLPHGEDELLRFLGHLVVQAAHTVLEQDRADACVWG